MTKRFVIQKHQRQNHPTHWDLMLEFEDHLKCWRLQISPEKISDTTATVEKIFDHDKKFLDYHGSVNNGKGTVQIADTGTYRITEQSDKSLQLLFAGKFLKGNFSLTPISENFWELTTTDF